MMMLRAIGDTLGELFQLMWRRRLWWLIPMLAVLLIFAGLLALAGTSGLGPLIYTLF